MAGFNGFSALAQGLGSGYAGGVSSASGAMQNLLAQVLAEKKRRQMFDAQQAQARSINDTNLAQKREEDATKRLDIEERGAEKGLRLAPVLESPETRNARVAGEGAAALDVRRAGGQLLPQQAAALRATSSLGGVLGTPSAMARRPVGQRWERDAALAGPTKPAEWKKGAAYDIEDQAIQAVKARLGTQQLMDAITSNALLPPEQRQDMGAISGEWRNRQSQVALEVAKAALGAVDLHEQSGEISPDEANRLRAFYRSRWGGDTPPPDKGAPAGGASPATTTTTTTAAAASVAVPANDAEHKANLDAVAANNARMAEIQAKIDAKGPSMANVGAGEAEGDGEDAAEGGEAGELGRNMNAAFDSLRNDTPASTSAISGAMRGIPDLRQQLVGRNTPNPIPEGVMNPTDDEIMQQFANWRPPTSSPWTPKPQMPVIPPGPQLDPYIRSLAGQQMPPPQMPPAMPPQQQPQQPPPFMPPFRQRPGFSGAPTLPGATAPSMPPPPPQRPSPMAGAGQLMQALGLGGLGMPGAGAMPTPPSAPPSMSTRGGLRQAAGPQFSPPGASMPSMFSPPSPQQFQTTMSQGPHFPRQDELTTMQLPGGRSASLMPDAAQSFASVLMNPNLSPQQRALLSQVASSTRSPESQDMLAWRRQMGDYSGLATDSSGNPVPAPEAGSTPPKSGHLAGSGLDLAAAVAQDPQLAAALQAAGWRRPLGEGDPVHWEYRQQW